MVLLCPGCLTGQVDLVGPDLLDCLVCRPVLNLLGVPMALADHEDLALRGYRVVLQTKYTCKHLPGKLQAKR